MPPLGSASTSPLLDAGELALAIARHDTVDAAVRADEQAMLLRSTGMARLLDGAADGPLSTELPGFATADGR